MALARMPTSGSSNRTIHLTKGGYSRSGAMASPITVMPRKTSPSPRIPLPCWRRLSRREANITAKPTATNANESFASRAAMRMSYWSAMVRPTPTAAPFSAPITGFFMRHGSSRSGGGRSSLSPTPEKESNVRVTLRSAAGDLEVTLGARIVRSDRDPEHNEQLVGMVFGTIEEKDRPALEALISRQQEGQFDLILEVFDTGGRISAFLKYDLALFRDETVTRMAGHLVGLLRAMATDPGQSLGDLRFLEEGERRELLHRWNPTQTDYPSTSFLHGLIDGMAAERPDAVAVVCGDCWTQRKWCGCSRPTTA